MTIAERINLHRCGYSRAEIDALAQEEKEAKAAEQNPAENTQPEQNTTQETQPEQMRTDEPAPDPVLEAIKGLTAAIQASNINKTPQPEKQQETVSDLLKNL